MKILLIILFIYLIVLFLLSEVKIFASYGTVATIKLTLKELFNNNVNIRKYAKLLTLIFIILFLINAMRNIPIIRVPSMYYAYTIRVRIRVWLALIGAIILRK